jgi:hypothetical protein
MEGKGNPPDGEIVLLRKSFNTPGNEIAPGSDVIGENLHEDLLLLTHETLLLVLDATTSSLLNQILHDFVKSRQGRRHSKKLSRHRRDKERESAGGGQVLRNEACIEVRRDDER